MSIGNIKQEIDKLAFIVEHAERAGEANDALQQLEMLKAYLMSILEKVSAFKQKQILYG